MNMICRDDEIDQYFKKDPDAFCINEEGVRRCRSVHFESQYRFLKAQEESKKKVVRIEEILKRIKARQREAKASTIGQIAMRSSQL